MYVTINFVEQDTGILFALFLFVKDKIYPDCLCWINHKLCRSMIYWVIIFLLLQERLGDAESKKLWNILDKRMAMPEYVGGQAGQGKKVR